METAIISGKGGTGKSFISTAFATLNQKVVLADCDVDAANLYLIFDPEHEDEEIYIGGQKAEIDQQLCTQCGLCKDYCRFDAISIKNHLYIIDEVNCDGCQLCERICPENAITMIQNDKSRMYSGTFRNGKMVYGRLAPGEENSGKLVNKVREKAKEIASKGNIKNIIIDGPPGIGCALISSITGVNNVVIVTEPSLSSVNDFKRLLELTSTFSFSISVIINKYDLNPEISEEIKFFCHERKLKIIAEIPFDKIVVEAMVNRKSIIEWQPNSIISNQIVNAFHLITTIND